MCAAYLLLPEYSSCSVENSCKKLSGIGVRVHAEKKRTLALLGVEGGREFCTRSHPLNYQFYWPLSLVTLISHLQNRTFRSVNLLLNDTT